MPAVIDTKKVYFSVVLNTFPKVACKCLQRYGAGFPKSPPPRSGPISKEGIPPAPGLISQDCLALSGKQKGWARAKPPILKKA